MNAEIVANAPSAGPGSRPCSQCQNYVVGPDNGWLCYRCGFDGPLARDLTDETELAP